MASQHKYILIQKVVPVEFKLDVTTGLLYMDVMCTARKPICAACIIEDLCEFTNKTE